MTPHSRWLIRGDSTTEQLLQELNGKFHLEPMQIRHETLTFFDDFEWHLWHKQQLLACNQQGQVVQISNHHLKTYSGEKTPRFAQESQAPQLRHFLQKQIGQRRLFPMAELEVEFCHYAVRNKDMKKVCDLNIVLTGYGTMAELKALRGYGREYRKCLQRISRFSSNPLDQHIFFNSLSLLGVTPDSYRARPEYHLQPELTAAQACTAIAAKLWDNVQRNEEGIIKDWDSEFLHQYRVSLRRMRTLFSQSKGVFHKAERRGLCQALKRLSDAGAELRDLDVFLANRSHYESLTPQNLRPGLETLFSNRHQQRNQAQARLSRQLKSSTRQHEKQVISDQLTRLPHAEGKNADQPAADFAAARILRSYRRISLNAQTLSPDSPDEQVHQIRLEGKKLRYLLEFFADLLPEKKTRSLLKALKKLQNRLGEFNDCAVQRQHLQDYLQQNDCSDETEAALHALSGILFHRQQQHKKRIFRLLEKFQRHSIQQKVAALTERQDREI